MMARIMVHAVIAIVAAAELQLAAMSAVMVTQLAQKNVMMATKTVAMAVALTVRLKPAMVSVAVSMQGARTVHVYATSKCSIMYSVTTMG
jgi:hypothetical protein